MTLQPIKLIRCGMCGAVTRHIDIGVDREMWKCVSCGEYNKPKENA